MSKNVPTPVAAAIGIVPTVLDSARRIPGKVVQIPVLAISTALGALETARQEYTDLAERGERLLARVRGESLDGLEDWAESLVEDTPLARPYEVVEDTVEDAVSKVTELLDRSADKPVRKVDTAATPDVVETVEAVVAEVAAPEVTAHAELPLADYDHLTLGSLRGRLRSLSVEQLVQVRDYEKAHAHRLPVVTLMDNRIAKLATEAAAPAPVAALVVEKAPIAKKAAPAKKATAARQASAAKKPSVAKKAPATAPTS